MRRPKGAWCRVFRVACVSIGTVCFLPHTGSRNVHAASLNPMETGPLQSYTISLPQDPVTKGFSNLVTKAVAIRLSDEAAIYFDTELLRVAAGWTGGWLDRSMTHLTTSKGELHVRIVGKVQFQTIARPGWQVGVEPREDPRPLRAGPLPPSWGRYSGLYRHGNRVLLEYRIDGRRILDYPAFLKTPEGDYFYRDIHIDPGTTALRLHLADWMSDVIAVEPFRFPDASGTALRFKAPDGSTRVAAWSTPGAAEGLQAELAWDRARSLALHVPPHQEARTFRVVLGSENTSTPVPVTLRKLLNKPAPDWEEWTGGGPSQWAELPALKGRRSTAKEAYVVDTLPVPLSNPWNSWMRLVGMDFFSDGRAAVSTWNGDVWIVSGIDDSLEKVRWKRHASGLFEGLGVKVVDDVVHVLERHQITRLQDVNGDGEADYYECFNNDGAIGPSYHAFAFGLETDREGNFYYTRCGHRVDPGLPLNGGVIRVQSDGSSAMQWATGMRAPNGMSLGANGKLTTSDNQGHWVPTSRVDLIQQGGFYGYVPHARQGAVPDTFAPPLCWIPYALDNSSGGQVWVDSDRWGPLAGHLLHTSYGKSSLFDLILDDNGGDPAQALVVPFPLRFDSGIMRGRFHPRDGQLYLCGLKGWQTSGVRDGGLFRVRYTGKPLRQVIGWTVLHDAVRLRFDTPLDPATASDPDNYSVEQWNYAWTENYGSPEYSVREPGRMGRDELDVSAVRISADGRAVQISLPGLKPVMQIRVRFRGETKEGEAIHQDLHGTIHRVPDR